MRHRGSSNPKWHLSRAGATVIGTYTGRASEAVQVLDPGHTAIGCTPTHAKRPHRPHLPRGAAPHQCEGASARRGENTNLKGKEPAQTLLSGLLLQQLGT